MPRTSTTWVQRPPNSGRKKGDSKAAKDIKDFFKDFYSTKEYRDNVKARILKGKALPIETLGYYYLYGKPKERLQLLNGAGQEIGYDDLIGTITIRLTRQLTARRIGSTAETVDQAGASSPELGVEGLGTPESAAANGDLEHVADPLWEGLG